MASAAEGFAQYVAPTLLGVARRALVISAPEEATMVLDLGSNTGLVAFLAMAQIGPDGTVVARDPSSEFLAVGQARAATAGYRDIRWQLGYLESLDYADEAFDRVISVHALGLVRDPNAMLAEAHRVTVADGSVVCATWGAKRQNEWIGVVERAVRAVTGQVLPRPSPASEPGNLEAMMQACGFESIESFRYADPLRVTEAADLWSWATALRVWRDATSGFSAESVDRVIGRIDQEIGGRSRGGEIVIGRDVTIVRGLVSEA